MLNWNVPSKKCGFVSNWVKAYLRFQDPDSLRGTLQRQRVLREQQNTLMRQKEMQEKQQHPVSHGLWQQLIQTLDHTQTEKKALEFLGKSLPQNLNIYPKLTSEENPFYKLW